MPKRQLTDEHIAKALLRVARGSHPCFVQSAKGLSELWAEGELPDDVAQYLVTQLLKAHKTYRATGKLPSG